ncbi:MAG: hypothetical protein IT463_00900 [Planctomycetes bacterium]|nr:hypothetical protein [Planctomycetota bacterium]
MHKAIMIAGILSMVTLAAAGGALIWWTRAHAEDAGFVRDYLVRLNDDEKGQLRGFLAHAAQSGEITDKALKDFLVDEELKARIARIKDSEALEHVLLANIASQREDRERKMEQSQAMIDRMAARSQGYDALRQETESQRKEAAEVQERSEKALREWNEKMRSERLNQLVADLDKSREPEELLPQLQYLPTSDLFYVLTRARNQGNRASVFGALPPETQRALAQMGANPAGIATDTPGAG